MPGALIVSSGEKGRDMLCGVLTDMGAGDISTVTSGAEARRGFADADWQVILINTPLSDEFGHELAVFAAGSTGACAAVVASVLNGHCKKDTDVDVLLLGGTLTIRYTGDTVLMTGNAVEVFTGTVEV